VEVNVKVRNRNWRREQRASAIARARVRARLFNIASEEWVRRSAVTPHPCSGHCCGNPRRWFGEATMGERRAPSEHEEW